MPDSIERARGYRHRAEELRTIAAESMMPETRATLEKVARQYDQMADHIDGASPSGAPTATA